ncbi:MAG: ChaN family lipoprotein [Acidobacteria bacterium]|nr:ChaN family lipoprotein [Acidobacteriota bacterium]
MAVGSRALPLMLAAALSWPVSAQQVAGPSFRIVESASGGLVDLEVLATRLAAADVAFLGEQHDDETTHRVQLLLLEAVAERRNNVSLALEMFERDVQEPLDHFQMGHTSEAEFLAEARAWPRYAGDYKPLVDFAIAREWTVVAANVPRRLAAEVATSGRAVLAGRSDSDRRLFAADLRCEPAGDYFHRFVAALGTHGQTLDETARVRYYESQCLKDETMAESIAQTHAAGSIGGRKPLVISVNGTVHSDFGLGTVERVARRLPQASIVTVTMVPVASLDDATPSAAVMERADFVVWTVK